MNLNTLLMQSDSLRFKLLGIIGRDEEKKKKIISYLLDYGWKIVDVESELLPIRKDLETVGIENTFELGAKVKEWFNAQPSNLILINASILYHDLFLKISPIGAFKYNSRNKNCVLFLEDEHRLGKRIYHGQPGTKDYYDQEISDIILIDIKEIEDDFQKKTIVREIINDYSKLDPEAIGNLFNFCQIKDVIDIDADLGEINKRHDLVKSYVISESLENQISEFFDNLVKPNHKASTVIGNYGSGKSHLIAFIVSLVLEPAIVDFVKSEKIKKAVKNLNRKFYTVQFELQAGQVELKHWFFGKIRQQLKSKYDVSIPIFDPIKDFDDKDNIKIILDIIKKHDSSIGLLVIIDEISDFLSAKQKEAMKADLQFLRVIGQVCQDQDLMFVGSMQEDIFTSPKFKDVASELGRIGERFQNIIIHKEDIKKVISERIVPKTKEQRHKLEKKLSFFAEKIDDVSRNTDEYIDLFPLTPFLLELFNDLPYFEKRGVIQFAISEIKYLLNEKFPYFITFEKIYDILASNPNKKNLEEIYEITKVMGVLSQKITLLENKFKDDALKIIKALSIYSLWNKREKGATSQELANNLMMLPQKKIFSASDHISLIIKKIRDVTEGEYIKALKDEATGVEYFQFITKAGVDAEQKISQKASAISNSEIEYELFNQIADILDLERLNGSLDIFNDECEWKAVKSFRKGYLIFVKEKSKFTPLPNRDYAIVLLSPFVKDFKKSFAKDTLTISLIINRPETIELLKEIVAIKALIENNFQKNLMLKKLEGRINGYSVGQTQITGLKYRLVKILMNSSECTLNGKPESIKSHIGKELNSIYEIIDEFKTSLFDEPFNKAYPLHPKYSIQLSSANIISSLTNIASDLSKGDFNNLAKNTTSFLQNISMLDHQGYPDISQSKIAQNILDIVKANKNKVTDIQKELVNPLCSSQYGLEPEIIHFTLIVMTVLGKVFLQAKGGDKIDINNIKEKFKSLSAFETIAYVKVQEDYSYDFAARLLNAIGLNGTKITIEKERLNAFKEYKEKIYSITKSIKEFEDTINKLFEKQTIHIKIDDVKKDFSTILEIDWNGLNINNHTQFSSIESSYNQKLSKITIAISNLKEIIDAVYEYQKDFHDAISYMNNALDLLSKNKLLVIDAKKLNTITGFRDDVINICKDFSILKDRSQRNPVKGKIQQFKKSFIYDFYFPAHEKYVGKKVEWDNLNSYLTNPVFKKIKLLNDVTCISDTKFKQMVLRWNELEKYKCINSDLEDQLQNNVRCPDCLFPAIDSKYSIILAELDKIEEDIEAIFDDYEKIIVKEISEYKDNIQYLDNESEKIFIQNILKTKSLPEIITSENIKAINKLFKEIVVVEIDTNHIIKALFPNQDMTTLEDLRKRFFALEDSIKKNKQENEVRIKFK
ncbi:MAG: hypothetical protein HQK79_19845 [Desulfobacterales bacterium]|nr:hypothetical protein [Desulfobacterales bacterium]